MVKKSRGGKRDGGAAAASSSYESNPARFASAVGDVSGEGSTFRTAGAVAAINATRFDDNARDRRYTRDQLESIADGQSVTIYHQMRDASGSYVPNTAEGAVVYTKRGADNWATDDGSGRKDTSDLVRKLHSPDQRYELGAGRITTEHYENYTSDTSRTTNGLSYRAGVYDIMANRGEGAKKYSQRGAITRYEGADYGVARENGSYNITHIPTGMSIGRANSMSAVSDTIRQTAPRLEQMGRVLKGAEERFKKTVRGDYL